MQMSHGINKGFPSLSSFFFLHLPFCFLRLSSFFFLLRPPSFFFSFFFFTFCSFFFFISVFLLRSSSLHQSESKTPKQRLLGWVQNKLPDMPINNFRDDWNSGKALGALVDSCAPGNGRNQFAFALCQVVVAQCRLSPPCARWQDCVRTGRPGTRRKRRRTPPKPCSWPTTGWASRRLVFAVARLADWPIGCIAARPSNLLCVCVAQQRLVLTLLRFFFYCHWQHLNQMLFGFLIVDIAGRVFRRYLS